MQRERRPFPQFSLITVPRSVCRDDPEVRQFVAGEMLNFNHAPMTAHELCFDANCRFGPDRCASLRLWFN